MNKIRVVVADDEYFNRELIGLLICRDPDFEVVGWAENVRDAESVIYDLKPEVLFVDIKMPDGSGFDLLCRLNSIAFRVVFVTGFDEYLIRAFENNAFDYILKPIDTDKFSAMLRALSQVVRQDRLHPLTTAIRIPVPEGEQVQLLEPASVAYLRFAGGKTTIATSSGRIYSTVRPLNEYESLFAKLDDFYKIDENHFINVRQVERLTAELPTRIVMRDGALFEIKVPGIAERIIKQLMQ